MTKADVILEHIIKIERTVGSIEEHLRTLNGRVEKSEEKIEENKKSINNIKHKLAYFAGGLAVLVILVEIGIKFI